MFTPKLKQTRVQRRRDQYFCIYSYSTTNRWHLSSYWDLGAGRTEEALAALPVYQPLPSQELFSKRAPEAPVETHSRPTSTALSAERHRDAPASVSGGRVCGRRGAQSGKSERPGAEGF